ncbi:MULTISPECIES: hypothetical protein [unclassified Rhodanobacter]|uniref:hypothetical protein n=1 Tax=unclassified Rhodanobacter TaxID=2621553 RepID=UPI001BDFBF98|nr:MULTISPECIES: hypothetical protein [unclassified Rhodanobacter]MBT2145039.1 hypothetical protein [Rhodanobacter sp. LX-99]MBT2149084.1 hypothetical protein [Rhodanobacter sp. LX-100]
MTVRLTDFNAAQFDGSMDGEECVLLKRAHAGDELAAAELLMRYTEGRLENTIVKQTISLGYDQVVKHIAVHALKSKGESGRALPVSPRMFFNGLNASGTRGPKSRNGDKKLNLFLVNKAWLTRSDLKTALVDRPATIHRVEAKLVEHVQAMFPGASQDTARAYVHQSYPGIPWEDRNASVEGYDAL